MTRTKLEILEEALVVEQAIHSEMPQGYQEDRDQIRRINYLKDAIAQAKREL